MDYNEKTPVPLQAFNSDEIRDQAENGNLEAVRVYMTLMDKIQYMDLIKNMDDDELPL